MTPSNFDKRNSASVRSNSFSILRSERLEQQARKYNIGPDISSEDDFENFGALCRGEQLLVNYNNLLKSSFGMD